MRISRLPFARLMCRRNLNNARFLRSARGRGRGANIKVGRLSRAHDPGGVVCSEEALFGEEEKMGEPSGGCGLSVGKLDGTSGPLVEGARPRGAKHRPGSRTVSTVVAAGEIAMSKCRCICVWGWCLAVDSTQSVRKGRRYLPVGGALLARLREGSSRPRSGFWTRSQAQSKQWRIRITPCSVPRLLAGFQTMCGASSTLLHAVRHAMTASIRDGWDPGTWGAWAAPPAVADGVEKTW